MPKATLCSYLLEWQVIFDKQAVRQLHTLFVYKGKYVETVLLPECIPETGNTDAGFYGQAFSSYFLMEIVPDKHQDIDQDGGIVCMMWQENNF